MLGRKTGGRKKGTKNKAVRGTDVRYLPKELAIKIAKLDQTGGLSMAEIQVNAARWMSDHAKTQRILGNIDAASKYDSMASKIAHDVSPFIYATQAGCGTRATTMRRRSEWKICRTISCKS
jgi:hypothetical protein